MTDLRKYTSYPLGIRNNNPGNLRYVPSIKWKGQVGSASGFAVFDNVENGIRAMAIDLRSKINKGLDTLNKYIPVYAPPSENDTTAYINNMSSKTGIAANSKIDFNRDITKLVKAHISIENGSSANIISDSMIQSALSSISGGFTPIKNVSIVLIMLIAMAGLLYITFKN